MKLDLAFGLENAAWPAFVVDTSGVVRQANPAAVQTFGTVMEGGPALSASIWALENDLAPQEFLAKSERSSIPMTPLVFRVKGGSTARFHAYVCSILREGQKFYLFQLFRDGVPAAGGSAAVHPAQAAGQSGRESETQLLRRVGSSDTSILQKQKLECALQLARTVALDFNNALTSILGHASWVLSKMEPGHPWRLSLAEVEKAAQRAAEIAEDLAAFSRQEKDSRTQTPSNLNDLVRNAVEAFQRPGLPNVLWTLQLEKQLFAVKLDEAKMQQAFIKILENSVEAVAGREGRITVRTHNQTFEAPVKSAAIQLPAGNYVCVEIADNGRGIAQDVLPRVFEPFYTTKTSPEHRGLGLAWVYGIVTNHDGTVLVTSPPGQGTIVRVFLPAQKRIVKDQGTRIEELRGHETVLMVDNDDMVLALGETILASAGYKVWVASNGQRALELLSQAPGEIELIITDLVMPGMSGRELIDRVRRLSPTVPILSISGYVRPSIGEQEDEFYLRKPYTTQELLRKVKQVLAHSEPT